MKNLFKILLLVLMVVFIGCTNQLDSNQKLCFTPPSAFNFEILNKTSGENLFTNGTYQSNQITIIDLSNNSKVPFTFIAENGQNIISIHTIGWKTEKINYSITIQEKALFSLYVDASRISDGCSYTEFNEVAIKNSDFEFNQNTVIYKIFVP